MRRVRYRPAGNARFKGRSDDYRPHTRHRRRGTLSILIFLPMCTSYSSSTIAAGTNLWYILYIYTKISRVDGRVFEGTQMAEYICASALARSRVNNER